MNENTIYICGQRNDCRNLASEDHTCPYNLELSDFPDQEAELCNCCDECTSECANSV
jgi:hypothetical protein